MPRTNSNLTEHEFINKIRTLLPRVQTPTLTTFKCPGCNHIVPSTHQIERCLQARFTRTVLRIIGLEVATDELKEKKDQLLVQAYQVEKHNARDLGDRT